MEAAENSYINTIYDPKKTPVTVYPELLAKHLIQRFSLPIGGLLLEPGCGRGDFLRGFAKSGMKVKGCDLSKEVKDLIPEHATEVVNIEEHGLPYKDNHFDVVYSKSLLEHLHNPEKYLKEAWRVLKPGGICLTLVPDWESNYKIYFDDFTHRTPFTKVSLSDIATMCSFTEVKVELFRQLPVVWKYPILNFACAAIAPFVPVRSKIKFLRWSKELMLLGYARKPG